MPNPLSTPALHEFHAARESDGVALDGLGLGLACRSSQAHQVLWIRQTMAGREMGELYPTGLAEFGFNPARLLLVYAHDAQSALQAGLEGARCPALGTVIITLWGVTKTYDLTASRRLALAAKASAVPVLVLRIAASPVPSAAETRWLVRPGLSVPLAANAPGNPVFDLTLLRARNGQEGLRYRMEWNRDAGEFVTDIVNTGAGQALAPPSRNGYAALSGTLVPVSFDRPGAPRDEPLHQRRAG